MYSRNIPIININLLIKYYLRHWKQKINDNLKVLKGSKIFITNLVKIIEKNVHLIVKT